MSFNVIGARAKICAPNASRKLDRLSRRGCSSEHPRSQAMITMYTTLIRYMGVRIIDGLGLIRLFF